MLQSCSFNLLILPIFGSKWLFSSANILRIGTPLFMIQVFIYSEQFVLHYSPRVQKKKLCSNDMKICASSITPFESSILKLITMVSCSEFAVYTELKKPFYEL